MVDVLRRIPDFPLARDLLHILASFMEEPIVTTVVSSVDGLDAPNGVAVDAAAGCLCMCHTPPLFGCLPLIVCLDVS